MNSSGVSGWKTTSGFHGCVTAPITISRPGTSASTPQPMDFVKATAPPGRALVSGCAPSTTCPEDRSDDRRLHQIYFAGGSERYVGWRGDSDVAAFGDVVRRGDAVVLRNYCDAKFTRPAPAYT